MELLGLSKRFCAVFIRCVADLSSLTTACFTTICATAVFKGVFRHTFFIFSMRKSIEIDLRCFLNMEKNFSH